VTLLDDRPEAAAKPSDDHRFADRVLSAPTSSWRFASRLARREVRRRPGRTILVMLLVILPVIGMTTGSILYRTSRTFDAPAAARQYGTADLLVNPFDPGGEPRDVLATVAPLLPDGSTTTEYVEAWSSVSADVDGVVVSIGLSFTDVDLDDPITAPTVVVDSGRTPEGADEVLLSPDVAERFDTAVGDSLELVRPDLDLTVVGIGREAHSANSDIMVVGEFDRDLLRPDRYSVQTLIDLPDDVTTAEKDELIMAVQAAGLGVNDVESWVYTGGSETARDLAWGWVAGVVSLVAVGIVIAAAFATSARRQLVTIGQLSANGAPERLIRRTMGLQGFWTGLFGSIAGVAVALAALLVARRLELLELFTNSVVRSLTVMPLDLVIIVATATSAAMAAASIPARSAARIPVLSALAGRRPVATPPSWMAPVGVVAFVVGLFLLGGVASSDDAGDFGAMLAVIGSMSILFGIVCASPLIVAAVGDIGSRAGGVVRLAARSLGRARARSAAVLTAIATVGSLAMVGATVAPNVDESTYEPDLTFVSLNFYANSFREADLAMTNEDGASALPAIIDPGPIAPSELPVDIRQGVERALPDAEWTPVTRTIDDPLPFRTDTGQTVFPDGFDAGTRWETSVTVADEALTAQLDLSPEQEEILDADGVLGLSPFLDEVTIFTPVGSPTFDLTSSLQALGFDRVPVTDEEFARIPNSFRDAGWTDLVVSPAFVETNEMPTAVHSYRIQNPTDLTGSQRDLVSNSSGAGFGQDAFVADATASGYESLTPLDGNDASGWATSYESPQWRIPDGLIEAAVIAASMLLVLGVVAIGLSLAATESRDERDVLHAVGASPRTLRRVSAAKAWVLTTGAALVAVPAGYITIFVITRAADASAPFPFVVAGALLIGIPVVAAGSTLAVSALTQRFRPTTYSTLATD